MCEGGAYLLDTTVLWQWLGLISNISCMSSVGKDREEE